MLLDVGHLLFADVGQVEEGVVTYLTVLKIETPDARLPSLHAPLPLPECLLGGVLREPRIMPRRIKSFSAFAISCMLSLHRWNMVIILQLLLLWDLHCRGWLVPDFWRGQGADVLWHVDYDELFPLHNV